MATLTSFSANSNTYVVTLNFDVAISALDTTKLYATTDSTSTDTANPLYGTVTGLNTTTLTLTLSPKGYWAMLYWAANLPSTNYIYIADTSVTTPAYTTVPAHVSGTVSAPTTAPTVTSIGAQTNTNQESNKVGYNLAITFNGLVDPTAVGFTGITIQNTSTSPTSTYTLTGGTAFSTYGASAGNILYIKFNDVDYNAILNDTTIFTSTSNTYVKYNALAFRDPFGNSVSPGTTQASSFTSNVQPAGYPVPIYNDFIFGGSSGQQLSTDGKGNLSFTTVYSPPAYIISQNDNSGNASSVLYSNNGLNWTDISPLASFITATAFGNNSFVGLTGGNTAYRSTNGGKSWNGPITLALTGNFNNIAYGNNTFVALPFNYYSFDTATGLAARSTDGGQNWITSSLPTSTSWGAIAFGNGAFVGISAKNFADGVVNTTAAAFSTDNGASWTASTLPSAAVWTILTYGRGIFVASGTNVAGTPAIAYSTNNGSTWTASASTFATTNKIKSIIYNSGNATFYALGYSGTFPFTIALATSTDGSTWTTSTPTAIASLTGTAGGLISGPYGTIIGWGSDNSTNLIYTVSYDNGTSWSAIQTDPNISISNYVYRTPSTYGVTY